MLNEELECCPNKQLSVLFFYFIRLYIHVLFIFLEQTFLFSYFLHLCYLFCSCLHQHTRANSLTYEKLSFVMRHTDLTVAVISVPYTWTLPRGDFKDKVQFFLQENKRFLVLLDHYKTGWSLAWHVNEQPGDTPVLSVTPLSQSINLKRATNTRSSLILIWRNSPTHSHKVGNKPTHYSVPFFKKIL